MTLTVAQLNAMDVEPFVQAVGAVFEDSPWIARAAADQRPFHGLADLHASMTRIVEDSSEDRRVALIAAHPDLAGRLAREGRLTPASAGEQRAAGLHRLTPDETARFQSLNAAYRRRFGFPFVICARENTKETILAALAARLPNERQAEIRIALTEIAKIARFRLDEAIAE